MKLNALGITVHQYSTENCDSCKPTRTALPLSTPPPPTNESNVSMKSAKKQETIILTLFVNNLRMKGLKWCSLISFDSFGRPGMKFMKHRSFWKLFQLDAKAANPYTASILHNAYFNADTRTQLFHVMLRATEVLEIWLHIISR